jgi:hypothetical protein
MTGEEIQCRDHVSIGPPLAGVQADWAGPIRSQVQSEIVAAAHAACRLDPANRAEYLRKGLLGAPSDASLWIALFGGHP